MSFNQDHTGMSEDNAQPGVNNNITLEGSYFLRLLFNFTDSSYIHVELFDSENEHHVFHEVDLFPVTDVYFLIL